MIRRGTWILLALLAGLVGLTYYLRDLKARQTAEATPTSGPTALFNPADGSPTDIKIESSLGQTVEIGRDQSGTWAVISPTAAPASQAGAEAAATQIGALQVLANIQLGPDVVGLDKPSYTLTITFSSGKTHRLVVGSVTPIQNGYYAQLDSGPIQVVDKGGLDALLDLLAHPPYLATLTPVASPTPSPAPATDTPEVTSTSPGGTGTPAVSTQESPTTTGSPEPPTATRTP